jgi:putative aminopeptidase FrvX
MDCGLVNQYESVKIDADIVAKVREEKKKTGVPIGKFFEIAAAEKLTPKKKSKSK